MSVQVIEGDAAQLLRTLQEGSVHCCITSPPYWGLRDYGHPEQLGLEATPDEYLSRLVEVFDDVRRVLRPDGSLWVVIGDTRISIAYGTGGGKNGGGNYRQAHRPTKPPNRYPQKGLKDGDLVGIPWRLAFALREDGWYLRDEVIWHKPDCLPESCKDRLTRCHEHVFHLTVRRRYYHDQDAIREPHKEESLKRAQRRRVDTDHQRDFPGSPQTLDPAASCHPKGRNKRSVWRVASGSGPGGHRATYPTELIEPMVKASCPPGGLVLDPFGGSGTTGLVAQGLGRNAILIELNNDYAEQARGRCYEDLPLLEGVEL